MDNNKTISLALILSLAGIFFISLFCWIGMTLDNLGMAVSSVISIAVLALGVVASQLAIKAKKATSEFKKWRGVELVCLAIMVFAVALEANWVIRGITTSLKSDELRAEAHKEVNNTLQKLDDFQARKQRALDVTVGGLQSFMNYGTYTSDRELVAFVNNEVLTGVFGTLTPSAIMEFKSDKVAIINRGSRSVDLIGSFRNDARLYNAVIDNWYPFQIANLADSLYNFRNECDEFIVELDRAIYLPNIRSVGGDFRIVEPEVQSPGNNNERSSFAEMFDSTKTPTAASVGVFVVLVILFFSNYLLTPRSLRKDIEKGSKESDKYGILI